MLHADRTTVIFAAMSAVGKEIPKLLAVTLVRSGISKPYWQKRTLKALGLFKMHKTIVHKNTPSVVGMLSSIKELVHVSPVVLRSDLENSPNRGSFFLDNGEAFVDPSSPDNTPSRPERTNSSSHADNISPL